MANGDAGGAEMPLYSHGVMTVITFRDTHCSAGGRLSRIMIEFESVPLSNYQRLCQMLARRVLNWVGHA